MVSLSTMPSDLAEKVTCTDEHVTFWHIRARNGVRYEWKLEPGAVLGAENMGRWLTECAAGGYPLRIHWRRGDSGLLLYEQNPAIWGPDEGDEDGGAFPPVAPLEVEGIDIDDTPSDPFTRGLNLVLTQPQLFAAAIKTVVSAFRPDPEEQAARDRLMFSAMAEHSTKMAEAAAKAAAASELQARLASMYLAAGYEIDEQGNMIPDAIDEDADDDEPETARNAHTLSVVAPAAEITTLVAEDTALAAVEGRRVGDLMDQLAAAAEADETEPEPEPEPAEVVAHG